MEVETLVPGYHSFYLGELLRLSWGQGTSCLPISTYTILLFTTIGGCNIKEIIYFSRGNDAKAGVKPRALCMLGKALIPAKSIPSPFTSI